jgi:hypothetical protein
MTEVIDVIQMKIVYDKFIALRARQKVSNTKYRSTERGKAKTNEMHRNWVAKKKDDVEYKTHTNIKRTQTIFVKPEKSLKK